MRTESEWGCPLDISRGDDPPRTGKEGERRAVMGIKDHPRANAVIEYVNGQWRVMPLSVTCYQMPDRTCETLIKEGEKIIAIVEAWLRCS